MAKRSFFNERVSLEAVTAPSSSVRIAIVGTAIAAPNVVHKPAVNKGAGPTNDTSKARKADSIIATGSDSTAVGRSKRASA